MTNLPTLPNVASGYNLTDDYVAQQTHQGGRIHYALALPLLQVPVTLPVPDPDQPFEDNRRLVPKHARDFAAYVRDNPDWHSGPLTARTTSETVKFTPFPGGDFGELTVGILSIPRNARRSFSIIDGQHRVLGIYELDRDLNAELVRQRGLLASAVRNGEPTGAKYQKQIDELLANLDRIQRESIAIDLVIEDAPNKARQVFVDVAANALGITKSVQKRFDGRKVTNRALGLLLDDTGVSSLLKGKVDLDKDRVGGTNPNLIGAGPLADIVRILQVGIGGKVSAAAEKIAADDPDVERAYADTANRFFDALAGGFPDLADIVDGTKTAADLRDTSMVPSTTVLRILAGVFHNLEADGMDDAAITRFFSRIAKHVSVPVEAGTPSGDLWINAAPVSGAFTDGAAAPGARAQQVKELVASITEWATKPPPQL